MQISCKYWKSAHRLRVPVGTNGDEQLTCSHINAGSIGMQDRQLITPSMTLLSHGDLHAGQVPRARMQNKLPIEIAARRRSSSHICTQPRTHAFRRALKAPMSARAVAVTQPASTMIARLAFLRILSGQRPVARLPLQIRSVSMCKSASVLMTASVCFRSWTCIHTFGFPSEPNSAYAE
jgi:hypothetical protein